MKRFQPGSPDKGKTVLHLRSSGGMLGAESVILELAKSSPAFGYTSIVAVLSGRSEPVPEIVGRSQDNGIDAIVIPCNGRFDISTFRALKKTVEDRDVEIIHSHGYKENFYSSLACRGLPKVATNHLWKRTTRALAFYAWLDTFVIRFFDHVVGVSGEITEEMGKKGIPGAKLSHVMNGVDLSRFQSGLADRQRIRGQWGLEDDVVVGTISSLSPEKGHKYLFQSLPYVVDSFPKMKVLVVGEGGERKELEDESHRLGLDNHVVFAGARDDIPAILDALDVFAMPSLKEGMPMALLEAMAAGKAIIASAVGEIPYAIVDGRNGLLVPPKEPDRIKGALLSLLSSSELISRLGREARATAENRFSSVRMTEEYCRIYDRVLEKRRYAVKGASL